MDMEQKKEALTKAREYLRSYFTEVENSGSMFFVLADDNCLLRDLVYDIYQQTGIYIEVVAYANKPHFVGSLPHANLLQETYGGDIEISDTTYCDHDYEAWIWTAPQHLTFTKDDINNVKTVII